MAKKNKPKKGEKLYIVRTRVFAKNGQEAISKAQAEAPHEAFIDSEWERKNIDSADAIGFRS